MYISRTSLTFFQRMDVRKFDESCAPILQKLCVTDLFKTLGDSTKVLINIKESLIFKLSFLN